MQGGIDGGGIERGEVDISVGIVEDILKVWDNIRDEVAACMSDKACD